jgi:exopolysaccharide production protein ExoY
MTVQFHSDRRVREIGPQPRTSEPDVSSARSGDRNWRARGSGRPGTRAVSRMRRQSPTGGAIKRTLDISMALSAFVALSPLFILTALLIKLTDRGPIFYRHVRLGHGRRSFACVKFRTMVTNADEVLAEYLRSSPDAAAEWATSRKLKNDPRVTAVGAVLRKLSIDELPQLINVLRGEMSMVGPRPIVFDEVPLYGADIDFYFSARPGLTGVWQVSGRSDAAYSRRVALDRRYVENWSLWTDLVVVIKTVPAVLMARNAY